MLENLKNQLIIGNSVINCLLTDKFIITIESMQSQIKLLYTAKFTFTINNKT